MPAVYPSDLWAKSGGLISYGPDPTDLFYRAASYIDRILKGEKPGDLPVQAPTKYDLIINLKTAKALGVSVPLGLLNAADEVGNRRSHDSSAGVELPKFLAIGCAVGTEYSI